MKRLIGIGAASVLAACACAVSASAASAAATLNTAGSTLALPLVNEWGSQWGPAANTTVNDSGGGSGAGYKKAAAGTVDFGTSDAPLSAYGNNPPCNSCIQIPWALTGTGISFRIDGLRLPRGKALHLSPGVIAGIYLGQITNWNNPAITRLNKGASIPSTPITPFWRSDASGDSFAFSAELSAVSSSFARQVGASTQPAFPAGRGENGNGGMAQALLGTNGGIAYISVAYILANHLPAAGVQNRHGSFAVPNLNDIENAASSNHSLPGNNQVTIVNPPRNARYAYPFSTYTYVIVQTNTPQGPLVRSFINYALSAAGQSDGPRLGFAPMPKSVLNRARATVNQIQ